MGVLEWRTNADEIRNATQESAGGGAGYSIITRGFTF